MEINTKNSDSLSKAILAILDIAKNVDLPSLTTTQLVKYLYLLDYHYAQRNEGKTFTNIEWRFLHFGPYSSAISSQLDLLVGKSFIESKPIQSNTSDGVLYSLSDWKQIETLEKLGVARDVVLELIQHIKNFKTDLNKLLHYVYFSTEPMEEAKPNDILTFEKCVKIPFKSLKQIQMNKLNAGTIKDAKSKLAEIRMSIQKPSKVIEWQGRYDDVYFNGLNEITEFDEIENFKGKVYL